MKLLKRSMIAAVTLGGLLAAGATPASAIVGGRDASQSYPGMAALSTFFPGIGTAKCGAMLIHPRFLLTAAHCLSDPTAAPAPVPTLAGNVSARIGSTNRTTGGLVVNGKQVYLHPEWTWASITSRVQPCTCPPVRTLDTAGSERINLLKPLIVR